MLIIVFALTSVIIQILFAQTIPAVSPVLEPFLHPLENTTLAQSLFSNKSKPEQLVARKVFSQIAGNNETATVNDAMKFLQEQNPMQSNQELMEESAKWLVMAVSQSKNETHFSKQEFVDFLDKALNFNLLYSPRVCEEFNRALDACQMHLPRKQKGTTKALQMTLSSMCFKGLTAVSNYSHESCVISLKPFSNSNVTDTQEICYKQSLCLLSDEMRAKPKWNPKNLTLPDGANFKSDQTEVTPSAFALETLMGEYIQQSTNEDVKQKRAAAFATFGGVTGGILLLHLLFNGPLMLFYMPVITIALIYGAFFWGTLAFLMAAIPWLNASPQKLFEIEYKLPLEQTITAPPSETAEGN